MLFNVCSIFDCALYSAYVRGVRNMAIGRFSVLCAWGFDLQAALAISLYLSESTPSVCWATCSGRSAANVGRSCKRTCATSLAATRAQTPLLCTCRPTFHVKHSCSFVSQLLVLCAAAKVSSAVLLVSAVSLLAHSKGHEGKGIGFANKLRAYSLQATNGALQKRVFGRDSCLKGSHMFSYRKAVAGHRGSFRRGREPSFGLRS